MALVVTPGVAESMRLETVPDARTAGGEVLVRTLELGVCGTDRTIDAGDYGAAAAGSDRLIVGHEVVGVVEKPAAGFERGDVVAATVRRPCGECENCEAREMDACLTGRFFERGIIELDGFGSELFAERPENLVRIPDDLGRLGVLAEPASICERGLRQALVVGRRQGWQPKRAIVLGVGAIGVLTVYLLRLLGIETWAMARGPSASERAELVRAVGARYVSTAEQSLTDLAHELGGPDLIMEAAGSAELVAEALEALGRNGVLCLRGIDARERELPLRSTILTEDLVLENKAVFGSTNARPTDWLSAVSDLEAIAKRWPDALSRLVGLSVDPARFREALAFRGVKATVRFA